MDFWNIFRRKRNVDFYALLLAQTQKTLSGCHALARFLEGGAEAEEVRALEQEADDIRRILVDTLHQTFITPMDREDFFALSRAIDDVLDYAYNTVEEIEAFEVERNEFLCQMTELLQKGAEELVGAVRHLKQNPNVALEHAVRAKHVKNDTNELFLAALKELFAGHDLRLTFTYREIYRHLNRSADCVDEAANIITNIVVKSR